MLRPIASMMCRTLGLSLKLIVGTSALAAAILTGGCASTGAVPRPFPATEPSASKADLDSIKRTSLDGQALAGTALTLRGVPYRAGGSDLNGFDCSGFTQYVFSQHGVPLPRGVRDQFDLGKSVKSVQVAPGDLLFFSTSARGASHVGIAIGAGQFVHAPSSTGVVRVERLSAAYWSRRYVGARRIN